MNEEYRQITLKGFKDYWVSNIGNIKSYKKTSPKVLSPKKILNKNGKIYNFIMLRNSESSNGRPKNISIAKLVAMHFIGPQPADDYIVDHINNISTDNRVDNLQWVSFKDNVRRQRCKPLKCTNYKTGESHICVSMEEASSITGCALKTIREWLAKEGRSERVHWSFEYLDKVTAKDLIDRRIG